MKRKPPIEDIKFKQYDALDFFMFVLCHEFALYPNMYVATGSAYHDWMDKFVDGIK